jgi:hypothetical protein
LDYINFIAKNEIINDVRTKMIVHYADSSILNDERYKNWIKSYKNKDCIHIYLDESVPDLTIREIYKLQSQLNMVDQSIYPLLYIQKDEFDFNSKYKKSCQKEADFKSTGHNIIYGRSRMEIFFDNDELELNDTNVTTSINNDEYKMNALSYVSYQNVQNIINNLTPYTQNLIEKKNLQNLKPIEEISYPQTIFFGTQSTCPSSVRNSSSIYVRIDQFKSILLDCSDDTTTQMRRYYGDDFDNQMVKLKAVKNCSSFVCSS